MASRSSQSGKRRRPGQRTEKERRASQAPAAAPAARGAAPPQKRRPQPGRPPGSAAAPKSDIPLDGAQLAVPQGSTLIYGRNPVREALRGKRRVHAVWLTPGAPGDDLEAMVTGWAREAAEPVPDIRQASYAELLELAGSPDHQSMVAAVDPYEYLAPEALLEDFTLLVALDEVQDPHNLGAIIRTAEGAGAGVVIPRHRAAEVTAAVVKASAGATEHAGIAQVRNLADFLAAAKAAGFWVYGAAAEATSGYAEQDYRYPTCFVVGSEGQGLGRRVESLCDVIVSLPLVGMVDSLNVSVSTGILLYEAVRQRRAGAAVATPAAPEGGGGS
jgi:23S rRNA (guanosine2251-2'-O)-methyltransferase